MERLTGLLKEETDDNRRPLPICTECGDPIDGEYMYLIAGECICQTCLDFWHRKEVRRHG